MAGSTVSSRPLVPSVRDDIKVPTGEAGDLTINVGQIKAHILADIPAPDLGDAVQYVNQSKTPDEKAIARSNIGAADSLALQQLAESTNLSIQEINTTLETVEESVGSLRTEYENTVSLLEQADNALQLDINNRVRYDVDTQNLSDVQQTNARTNIDAAKTDHTHTIADVNDLQNQLDAKATGQHSHTIADTTGLQSVLDGKESTSNKAVNLSTPDDVKYPTTKAVSDGLATKQNTITLGSVAQYLRGDLSLSNFASDVLGTALTGLVLTTNAAITATDTILAAFGKLQAQIDKRLRFDDAQTLTAAEQTQLRTNMGAAAGLEYLTDAGSSISRQTLYPKTPHPNASGVGGGELYLRGYAATSGMPVSFYGFSLNHKPNATVGSGSLDLQTTRNLTGTDYKVSGQSSVGLGKGLNVTGQNNVVFGSTINDFVQTVAGDKNLIGLTQVPFRANSFTTTGSNNVIFTTIGGARASGNLNILLGAIQNVSGSGNISITTSVGQTTLEGSNNILLGSSGNPRGSNNILLGNGAPSMDAQNNNVIICPAGISANFGSVTHFLRLGNYSSGIVGSDVAFGRMVSRKELNYLLIQANPVSGTSYSSSSDLLAASSTNTMPMGHGIIEGVIRTTVVTTSTNGMLRRANYKFEGVFYNNSLSYTLTQMDTTAGGDTSGLIPVTLSIVSNTLRISVVNNDPNSTGSGFTLRLAAYVCAQDLNPDESAI